MDLMKKGISIFLVILSILLITSDHANAIVSMSLTPTSDSVLPGGTRSVYPNVQGDANVSVTWSVSGGSVSPFTGYAEWTAPQTPGSYTVTATSIADNTKTATATFTVVTATVKASNIPMQATAFKNQPVVIQSILWGSTDTSVTWASSGGTLAGTGREVVFVTNAAGTYTVTSTINADNTKSATTTIVVTDNAWPAISTANKTMPIDCTATGSGSTYNVTTESEMDTVPWSTLGAGDTVRIHPGVYHKQILISTSGTDSQPIRICGVADGAGNLPEINGANATAKAGSQFGTGLGDIQIYGGITIYNYGSAYYGGANYPKNIIIEGLKLTGFNSGNTFTDLYTGLVTAYNKAAASIRIQRGGNITVRGNDISDCGNGIFTMSKNGIESQITRNLLVEGNYFHDNGVFNDYLEHTNYLQTFGLVVQGNYYDYPKTGMPGGQLKSRSVQQFIRYNYFKPASRMIDLVEEQDDTSLVFPWIGLDSGELVNTSTNDVVANLEAYQNQFVYGNILHNEGSLVTAWMVHGAADTSSQDYNAGGKLYCYNNTIYNSVSSSQNYRSGIFDFGPYQTPVGSHTVWPKAVVVNNAIYLKSDVLPAPTTFFWNRYKSDRVELGKNWISTRWGDGNTAGGDGTGIASANGDSIAAMWQGGQLNTQVSGISNLVTGASLPYDAATYSPIDGSPLIGTADALPSLSSQLPPLMQYSASSHLMLFRGDNLDIGAIGVDRLAPTVTVVSPIKSIFVELSGTVSDNIGILSLTVQLNGTLDVISTSILGTEWKTFIPGLVEGSNSLTFVATDTSGNISTLILTVFVDSQLPTIDHFSVPSYSSSLEISGISLSATDNLAATGYLISESKIPPVAGTVTLFPAPASYTAVTAGPKTLYAWARDAAGNVSALFAGQPCTIDTAKPTVDSFAVPATSNSFTVAGITMTASDNIGVTGYLITESSTPPDASTVNLTPAPTSYTASSAGPKTLYTWARDAAGNVSALYAGQSCTIDTTKPTVDSFAVPAASNSLTVAGITVTASDNIGVTGYLITENSTPPAASAVNQTPAPTSYTALTAGPKTLYAWVRDAAGNVSAAFTGQPCTIDTTKPTINSFTVPAFSPSLIIGGIALSAADNVAVTGYLITESTTPPLASAVNITPAPTSYTAASVGPKTLYAWARDAAGNVSAVYGVQSCTIDTTKPTINSFTAPTTSNSLIVSGITITAADNIGVIGYLITESSTPPVASAVTVTPAPTSYTASTAGAKALYAWARDAAGNVSAVFTSRSCTIDITLPVVDSFSVPAFSTSLTIGGIGLGASDNVGVTGYLITESSTPPAASAVTGTPAPTSYTASSAGSKTLYAWARDAAGNVSALFTGRSCIIDTTKPVINGFTVPATSTSLTVSGIALSASDNVGVTGYLITESSSAPTAASVNLSLPPTAYVAASSGNKTLYAWARDAAGNVSLSMSASVTINPVIGSYASLQNAYSTVPTGGLLFIGEGVLVESFTANRNVAVTIKGGFDATFSDNPGVTVINGKVIIQNGKVVLEQIRVR